jgi:raffinose/stachyose/melibiose transport system permease protein
VTITQTTGALSVETAGEARRLARGRHRLVRRGMWIALLFLAPGLLLNLLVIGGPSISNIYYAFTSWSGLGPAKFNGLDNAIQLIHDQEFWNALGHNFIYLVFFLTVPMAMGLFGAFALSRVRRGATAFRVLFFIPYLIASVVNAAIWKNILDPQAGLAPALDKVGVHFLDNVYFFGDTNLSLGSVLFVDNWHFWGFLVVLFLAATTNIDGSRYEAARIDGANAWQEFWYITLPGIRPTLIFALTIVALWSLLTFDYAYALTGGGPAGSSDLVSLLVNRTAFGANEAGYAAFMGLTVSALGAIFLIIIGILRRKGDDS